MANNISLEIVIEVPLKNVQIRFEKYCRSKSSIDEIKVLN